MMLDGKGLAESILQNCKNACRVLQNQGCTPTMAVVLVGDDPGSASYVRQKEKAAAYIGATLLVNRQSSNVSVETMQGIITTLNNDPTVHGIILQRPLPAHLQDTNLLNSVTPTKDVDGFAPQSPYEVPVAKAVNRIMQKIYEIQNTKYDEKAYDLWLATQHIVIIGRGETAGKPIANLLSLHNPRCTVITSQTKNPSNITKSADIIISCVGKETMVKKEYIKKGVMLISVGIWRDERGKLHGDYEEDDIKNIASFHTPTPGGVGPVNVACLMENLIQAAEGGQ